MITVSEAKLLIRQHIPAPEIISKPLQSAADYVLAEDVKAITDIPAFAQSSMDGYAVKFEDIEKGLIIKTTIQAGSTANTWVNNGEAARIFTGAPLPTGADTVIMQEKVEVKNGILYCRDPDLQIYNNVRAKGSEIQKDDLAVQKGSLLTPAATGFLAGIGIAAVRVYEKPKIALIITGDELQQPGQELQAGQVYDSNSYALNAALKKEGFNDIQTYFVSDNPHQLKETLKESLQTHTLILLTGGVSVGDYDFVVASAQENSIDTIFHKVKQKPGKPLFFGKKENALIFGLPGNPASVLTCYYQYVLPAIRLMYGLDLPLKTIRAVLTHDITKENALTQFYKAHIEEGKVTPLTAQESYRMSTFATSNCFIRLGENPCNYHAGDTVDVDLLPDSI